MRRIVTDKQRTEALEGIEAATKFSGLTEEQAAFFRTFGESIIGFELTDPEVANLQLGLNPPGVSVEKKSEVLLLIFAVMLTIE